MADTKVTNLSAIGTVAEEDLIYVVDDPGGTPVSNKIALSQVRSDLSIPKYTYSSSAPGSSQPGDLWWDSTTGGLMIYVSDGSDAAWVEPNAGAVVEPAVVLLDSGTVAGVSSFDVNFDDHSSTTYPNLKLVLSNADHSDDSANYYLQVYIDGGTTPVSASSYAYATVGNDDAGTSHNDNDGSHTAMRLSEGLGNDAGHIFAGEYNFYNWGSTAEYKTVIGQTGGHDGGTDWLTYNLTAMYLGADDVTDILIGITAGTCSLSWSLYGMR